MKHDNSEFAPEIQDYSVPDYSQPQFRSRRTSQPKTETAPVRKEIHKYFLRAFSKDAPMGKLFREHSETIDAHSTAIIENEQVITSQGEKITELEATNATLLGRINTLEETVLELIDATQSKEE